MPKTPDQGRSSGYGPRSPAVLAAKSSKPHVSMCIWVVFMLCVQVRNVIGARNDVLM